MDTAAPASTEANTQAPAPATGQSAEGTQTQETQTTEQVPASEVAQGAKDSEEKHPSRAFRRLDKWRQRAIAAEAEAKLLRELRGGEAPSKPAEAPASDEPKRDQFGTYEEFIEARATWKAEAAAEKKARSVLDESRKSTEQARAKGEQDKLSRQWNAQVDKARDEVEDFDEVCAESEAVVTAKMSEAILESDKGAFIAYYLAKNPGEAERISKLSPSKQVAAIVGLEDKVTKPAKQPSKAPEPIQPVGQKAEVAKDPNKMSDKEFAEWRKKQIAQRR